MKTSIITFLLACATLISLSQTITQAEYFIDTDKGVGKNTPLSVTLAADNSFTFQVNLTNVAPGIHRLYIRTKESNNKWSLTIRRTIEVASSLATPKFTKGEYFFDTDPGTGKAIAIATSTADTAITQILITNTGGLSPGYHRLYIRTRDNKGNWGLSTRKSIEIIRGMDTAKITAAEFFFSSDPGFGRATAKIFATQLADGTFNFNIPYSSIPAGADTLFVRIKDTHNKWSRTRLAKFSGAPLLASTDHRLPAMGTNITSLSEFRFAVNPNPIKHNVLTLNIRRTKPASLQMAVFSMDGKRVLSQQFTVNEHISRKVDASALSAGTYVIQLSDGIEMRSVVFIKE